MALDECEPNRWYCAFLTICHNRPGMGYGTGTILYGIEAIPCTYVKKPHSRNASATEAKYTLIF